MDAVEAFTNLAIVANVDGEIAYYERFLLDKYASELKLGPIVVKKILDEVKSGKKKDFVKPPTADGRTKLYKAMVKIVRSDGHITDGEQKLLRRLGNILEIEPDVMAKALETKQKDA